MRTSEIADRLRCARKALGLTQVTLARRAGVSTRLVAEVERGERGNVSLETFCRLLSETGLSLTLTESSCGGQAAFSSAREQAARTRRVAERRATWSGNQIRLAQEGREDPIAPPHTERFASVAMVSAQAFAVADSRVVRGRSASAPTLRGV